MADRIKIGDKVVVDSDRNLTVDKLYIKGNVTHITGADPTISGGGTVPTTGSLNATSTDSTQAIRVDTSFEGFSEVWPDRGSNKGYQVGGNVSTPRNSSNMTDIIERYPFAISSGSATDVAEMSQGARMNVGVTQSEENLYYWSGATNAGSNLAPGPPDRAPEDSAIYKFPFAASVPITQTAVPFEVHGVSHWHNSLYNGAMAVNVSKTHWYFSQGQMHAGSRSTVNTGSGNTVWDHTWGKFPFASDTSVTLAGDIRDVVTDRVWMLNNAGFNSHTDAITYSESPGSHPATANTEGFVSMETKVMWKFPFSNDTSVTIAFDNIVNQPPAGGVYVLDETPFTPPGVLSPDIKGGIRMNSATAAVTSDNDKGHYLANMNSSTNPEPDTNNTLAARRFGFSFPFINFTINSEVAEAYSQPSATHTGERNNLTNGNSSGYVTGGSTTFPTSASTPANESINKYPFAIPSAPAQDVGELTTGKYLSSTGVD